VTIIEFGVAGGDPWTGELLAVDIAKTNFARFRLSPCFAPAEFSKTLSESTNG
jgi:hypothetical protein